jgi:hypothetical protein
MNFVHSNGYGGCFFGGNIFSPKKAKTPIFIAKYEGVFQKKNVV